ncbi:MAG TPA: hypothetical protein VHS97_22325 [Isosphaeraceae bacterium]|nr:hypothetical protein [Isosphaeraceae bacterium]
MATDINTLLTDALIYVGAYAQGQTANSDDLALAFRVINRKLDSLSAEKLSMVGMHRRQFALTGLASYNFGPGLTWDSSTRPIKIKSASVIAQNGVEKECNLPTADQWAAIPDKTRTGIYVEDLFYDNGFPNGLFYVTPIPFSGSMILWSFEAIAQLAAQTGTVNFAPGYEQTILTIAARELCIAFQRPLTQELSDAAEQSKNVIVQLNAELFNAPMPPPQGPGPTSPPARTTT